MILLKERGFLRTASLRGREEGAYPYSRSKFFSFRRKQKWHAQLGYLKRVFKEGTIYRGFTELKGTNRNCWGTVPHLAINQICQAPTVGHSPWRPELTRLPSLGLTILLFLIFNLLRSLSFSLSLSSFASNF